MPSILFRCACTGLYASGWIADDIHQEAKDHELISVECIACGQIHMVSPHSDQLKATSTSPRGVDAS